MLSQRACLRLSDFMAEVTAAPGTNQVDFIKHDVKICKNTLIQLFYGIICGKHRLKVKSCYNYAAEISHCYPLNVQKKPKAASVFIQILEKSIKRNS